MSSSGTNVRPTMRFNGIVRRTTNTVTPMIVIGCAIDQFSDAEYQRSMARKNRLSLVLLSPAASDTFRKRELSIGVRVELTIIGATIGNAILQHNGPEKRA